MGQPIIKKRTKAKILLLRFFVPTPGELVPNLFISLLLLLIASYRVILVLLSNGTPITELSFGDVYGQRLDYVNNILQIPLLGRVVLFLFWLAIGSIVYMLVWLFQNFAVEVYDDLTLTQEEKQEHEAEEEGWWGTTLAHTIFIGCSSLLFLFYVVFVTSVFFPAWTQLFQVGLQSFTEFGGMFKMFIALAGMMLTIHIFILFWRLFVRVRDYIFNSF